MINEIREVIDYLDGYNIAKHECTFRMCYLLAKYYHSQNLEPIDIRKNIFNWANSYSVHIKHNVNDVIRMAMEDSIPLYSNDVFINDEDVNEIVTRFDRKNTRMCALGLLLYSKAHADEEGVFTFSQEDFAKWVGIQQPHLSEYFDELELFGYMNRIYSSGEQTFAWNGRIVGKRIKYKLKIPYNNEGKYKIEDNDIKDLYQQIFSC